MNFKSYLLSAAIWTVFCVRFRSQSKWSEPGTSGPIEPVPILARLFPFSSISALPVCSSHFIYISCGRCATICSPSRFVSLAVSEWKSLPLPVADSGKSLGLKAGNRLRVPSEPEWDFRVLFSRNVLIFPNHKMCSDSCLSWPIWQERFGGKSKLVFFWIWSNSESASVPHALPAVCVCVWPAPAAAVHLSHQSTNLCEVKSAASVVAVHRLLFPVRDGPRTSYLCYFTSNRNHGRFCAQTMCSARKIPNLVSRWMGLLRPLFLPRWRK